MTKIWISFGGRQSLFLIQMNFSTVEDFLKLIMKECVCDGC